MVGVDITQDNVTRTYVCSRVELNIFNIPSKQLYILFDAHRNDKIDFSYIIILTGERLKTFYNEWNNHRQFYIELCRDLGISEDIVPEDMNNEILD